MRERFGVSIEEGYISLFIKSNQKTLKGHHTTRQIVGCL